MNKTIFTFFLIPSLFFATLLLADTGNIDSATPLLAPAKTVERIDDPDKAQRTLFVESLPHKSKQSSTWLSWIQKPLRTLFTTTALACLLFPTGVFGAAAESILVPEYQLIHEPLCPNPFTPHCFNNFKEFGDLFVTDANRTADETSFINAICWYYSDYVPCFLNNATYSFCQ